MEEKKIKNSDPVAIRQTFPNTGNYSIAAVSDSV
jgi:hypothetical protein